MRARCFCSVDCLGRGRGSAPAPKVDFSGTTHDNAELDVPGDVKNRVDDCAGGDRKRSRDEIEVDAQLRA
jgi:hypothetical protein